LKSTFEIIFQDADGGVDNGGQEVEDIARAE